MVGTVDIVVPVFNEEACIDEFCARIARLGYTGSLIFVDNASTDGTLDRLESYPGLRIIRHASNEGYGASIRHGIASSDGELIVIIDADMEFPPEMIPKLVAALQHSPAVYCSRFLGPGTPAMSLFRRVGNRLLTVMYNLLFQQRTTDLLTGMKGLRRDAMDLSSLRQGGFQHSVEIGALIWLSGHQIEEIPIRYEPRTKGVSKMRHLPEAIKMVSCIVGYWLRCVVLRRPLNPDATTRPP